MEQQAAGAASGLRWDANKYGRAFASLDQNPSGPGPFTTHQFSAGIHVDGQVANTAPAVLTARRALQTLGQAHQASNQHGWPCGYTGPDRLPLGPHDWASNHAYHPGIRNEGNLAQATQDVASDEVARMNLEVANGRFDRMHRPHRLTAQMLASESEGRHRPDVHPASASMEDQGHVCEICRVEGKEKKVKDLKKHIQRVHINDRHHECAFCERKFHHPKDLTKHIDAVHSDAPSAITCHLCEKSLKYRTDNFDRHLREIHRVAEHIIQDLRAQRKLAATSGAEVVGQPSTPSNTSATGARMIGMLTPSTSRGSGGFDFCSPSSTPSERRFQ